MFKNIVFIVLLSLFLNACSESGDMHFDYSDVNNTLGLTVEPSNFGSAFENNPPFNPCECLNEAAYSGFCTLKIKMFDNAAENSAGSIKLMFYYNLDNNEDTIGNIKYHQLKFEYRNKP